MARPKGTNVVKDIVETKIEVAKKEKYPVLLRFPGDLEEPIKSAAKDLGLPVTKYIEMVVRENLRNRKKDI